jgi:Putative zinc- or iron-chelating domain
VPREIESRYDDPLDVIWLDCARALDFRIERSDEVYASFDGDKTLTLSTREHFDADDSLAQLLFHELCHALVAGVAGAPRTRKSDWGMENVDERDLLAEHACHRVQAALADRHGLRALLAVTTDHRSYWDALPIDPLAVGGDPAIPLAREAYQRAVCEPFWQPLEHALAQTARIAELLRSTVKDEQSLWHRTVPLHKSGFPVDVHSPATCADCGFSFTLGQKLACRKTRALPEQRGKQVGASDRACVRFEPKLDAQACFDCGACCREGFDRVDVRAADLIKKARPDLISVDGYGAHLARPGGLCVALTYRDDKYLCQVYALRPRACADFEIAGDACLTARRRVGLSA